MKLLYFGDAREEHLFRWSKYFTWLGHEVHVVTWNPIIHDGYEPIPVHLLRKAIDSPGVLARGINLLWFSRRIRRLIRQIKPDLIHAHSASASSWMAMATGFHPYMVTAWGIDVNIAVHVSKVERFLTSRTLTRADWLSCEGENTKQSMVSLGADPARILVQPFGVNLDDFKPGKPPRDFLEKYGLVGAEVVVSTRTLTEIHNVETVIRAAVLVLQKRPAVKFLIVSRGEKTQMLQELAESLGIGRSVVFTGYVSEPEMAACLQAADVYVSTSLSESGTAISMAEAMACKLPVVNTETGDIRLWLRDGEGGYIVPVKSPDAIAEKVLHLLEHPEEREHAGNVNRRLMEERYDVRVVMRRMEELYANLIAQAGSDAARNKQSCCGRSPL